MKKTFNLYAICWAILFVLFNAITFIIPTVKAPSFWIAYVLIGLSFIGQLICAYFAFKEDDNKKFFYNVSLITVSYSSTIVSVIIGIICTVIPFVPAWVGAVVCLIILTFSAVSILKAKAAIDIVSGIDEKVKAKTLFIKSLTVDAETLMTKAKSDSVKTELKKVYEAIRYSDPMSNEALSSVESQITLKFDTLSKAVEADDVETVKASTEEMLILVNDRNKKCRLLK